MLLSKYRFCLKIYSSNILLDDARKAVLIAALDQFNKKTCVRFVAKEVYDTDYIKFTVSQYVYLFLHHIHVA